MQILGLNTLDLLLLVILFVGVLVGFVRGALHQIISVISIWLGLVTTLWLYKPFSVNILQGKNINMSATAGDTLAFLILLFVFVNAYGLVVKYLTVPPEEKKKKKKSKKDPLAEAAPSAYQRFIGGPINAIGGIFMGLILTVIWLSLFLGVLQFIFQPTDTQVPYTGFANGLLYNLRTSTLLPYFNTVLSGLVQSVDLFVPRNADILKGFLKFIA